MQRETMIPHTAEMMKALSSPLRRAILRFLAAQGPATTTSISVALNHSTGTTSYHLRQLAGAGLISEVPDKPKGRERWWRTVPANRRPGLDTKSTEGKRLAAQLEHARLAEDMNAVSVVLSNRDATGDWFQGSRSLRFMTQHELKNFYNDYLQLLHRYGHDAADAPRTARPVTLRWFGLPVDTDMAT